MTHPSVILLGSLPFEAPALHRLVPEFGWVLETAEDLDRLRQLSAVCRPIAILFDAASLGLSWEQALTTLREADPQALLIPCYRFADAISWPDLADAGAFHALALPLDPNEVRQSLAFVWSARFRRAQSSVLAMPASSASAQPRAEQDADRPAPRSTRWSVPA